MGMFRTYFTAKEILGYKALFNMVLSDRSDGKTFDCKVRALEDFEKLGRTHLYVRRYDTEITPKMYTTFFNEVLNVEKYSHYGDKYDFKYSKEGVQLREKDAEWESKSDGWKFAVYFIPLSKAGKLKSQIDITNVYNIDFDEYIPLDRRYIKNEMELMLELWKSIDRDRDVVQLLCLGNRVDYFCPFLSYFDININIESKKLRLYRNNTLAIQIYENKEHREIRTESKFNDLVKGTSYEGYNNGGVLHGYELNISPLNEGKAVPIYSFVAKGKEGTVWNNNDGTYVFSDKKRRDLPVMVDTMSSANVEDKRDYIFAGEINSLFRSLFYKNMLRITNTPLEPAVMSLLRVR